MASNSKTINIHNFKEYYNAVEEYKNTLRNIAENCLLVIYDTNVNKFYHIKINNKEDFYNKTSYIDGDCEGLSDSLWYDREYFDGEVNYKLISMQDEDEHLW